jgi:hypothetical protein
MSFLHLARFDIMGVQAAAELGGGMARTKDTKAFDGERIKGGRKMKEPRAKIHSYFLS